jgi:hypothetical protein
MKWCCGSFKSQYDAAGQRGFAILVDRDKTIGPYFLWQHRATEMGNETKLSDWKTDFPVSLVSQTGLLFCPWCGKSLVNFYGRHAAELARPGFEIPLSASTS